MMQLGPLVNLNALSSKAHASLSQEQKKQLKSCHRKADLKEAFGESTPQFASAMQICLLRAKVFALQEMIAGHKVSNLPRPTEEEMTKVIDAVDTPVLREAQDKNSRPEEGRNIARRARTGISGRTIWSSTAGSENPKDRRPTSRRPFHSSGGRALHGDSTKHPTEADVHDYLSGLRQLQGPTKAGCFHRTTSHETIDAAIQHLSADLGEKKNV